MSRAADIIQNSRKIVIKVGSNVLAGDDGVLDKSRAENIANQATKLMDAGKQVFYLVPEISLTPQLVERIAERTGEPSVFHSKLTDKRRTEAFWSFAKGESPMIIGARSALFVPSERPGLIIVDEEHENTYKQEDAPAYNLRDMAVLYANIFNIPVILGSATPQVETVANARSGKYSISRLSLRHGGAELPRIEVIDLKTEPLVGGVIAEPIYDELVRTVKADKQAIIFLNRKGYATSLYCRSCGALQECTNCSVPLTMYKSSGRVSCHYCASSYSSLTCRECGGKEIIDTGAGTERVEEFINQMFPNDAIRIDAEKITSLKQLSAALTDFSEKKAHILIGTQLVAKGLHFPDVTFVGILGIDNMLAMPDFRACEKAYQMIMQVSGRAGRGSSKGSVYIQSLFPEEPLFKLIAEEPDAFYEHELTRRKDFAYPPYTKLTRLLFTYSKEAALHKVAKELTDMLRRDFPGASVLGPAPAPIYRIQNRFRLSVLIKTGNSGQMTQILAKAKAFFDKAKRGSMMMKIDRDPYYFM